MGRLHKNIQLAGGFGALIDSTKFLSPEVVLLCLYKSTIWPCMDTVVMSVLVLLIATWNCLISYTLVRQCTCCLS